MKKNTGGGGTRTGVVVCIACKFAWGTECGSEGGEKRKRSDGLALPSGVYRRARAGRRAIDGAKAATPSRRLTGAGACC